MPACVYKFEEKVKIVTSKRASEREADKIQVSLII
jgi:hypothetical protein